ncbi:SurA N-terminal domain-containing protein [Carboxydocella sp. JDF658]|uniref:SurA N-terminal domain-containing protein n=1 Tax=Carboxydocella sp. JDF658 TaxID=1926600 RepID=UPI0009AE74F7|nr:SurA N-terminal domain-containing protein [Carboxydocella sp. JDF658]GAW30997.1 hypothetical protein JDF658_07620 [Carboxydocella sp. JDF658]
MNKKIIIIYSFLCIFVLATINLAYSKSDEFLLGEKIKNLSKSEKIVAKINGIPVTEKEYESKKLFLETQKQPANFENVIRAIAEQKLLFEETKKRGITVTKEELDNFIQLQKRLSEQVSDEEKANFRDFLAGQGLTVEEYWSNPDVINAYERGIYIGKFKAQLRKELLIPENEKNSPKAYEMVKTKINEIVNKAKIEKLDDQIK